LLVQIFLLLFQCLLLECQRLILVLETGILLFEFLLVLAGGGLGDLSVVLRVNHEDGVPKLFGTLFAKLAGFCRSCTSSRRTAARQTRGVAWSSSVARWSRRAKVAGNAPWPLITAYGLFVEHYQKYDVIWNGENGETILFQNEMPYDPPSQAAWMHDGVNGFAAYKVDDSVTTHEAWGMGSYSFFNVGPEIHAASAFEAPVRPGVKLHDILSVFLNGFGGIDHVVNDTGAAVSSTNQVTNVVTYP
jgi:hypothetical protein